MYLDRLEAARPDAPLRRHAHRRPRAGSRRLRPTRDHAPAGIAGRFTASRTASRTCSPPRASLTTWGAEAVLQAGLRLRRDGRDAAARSRRRARRQAVDGELAVGDLWFRGRTRNPWNPERGSSGSSAGPASATAAGLVGFRRRHRNRWLDRVAGERLRRRRTCGQPTDASAATAA